MTYEETLEYLYNHLPVFHHIGAHAYKPGLENSIRLMERLGNPQNHYPTIHVAGTNGKGSVSHMLAAVLQSAGYRVGLYTSPHLVDFGERIRINGQKISQAYVIDFVQQYEKTFDLIKPSFFEATMAMAFAYFFTNNVDIAVIEVGLGGRLDSTNIIHPLLSVITNIGLDHTEFLGETLERIAEEKAGIIKRETPVVVGETQIETKPVFCRKAKQEQAPIVFADTVFTANRSSYNSNKIVVDVLPYGSIEVGLTGDYQLKNIATVLACIDELRKLAFVLNEESVRRGLSEVVELTGLQGRWQIVNHQPTAVLDTGHNKAGMRYVAAQLCRQTYERLHIVVGLVNDKDALGILSLLPRKATYYFTAAQTKRALLPNKLKAFADQLNLQGNIYPTVKEAIAAAKAEASADDFIFIGGSNFVVGEAMAFEW